MTLMCVVLTDDAVLLSADCRSSAYEADPRFPPGFPTWVDEGEKFMKTGLPALMWGYSGMTAIAKHLVSWAEKGAWSSWSRLAEDAAKQSAKAVRTVKAQIQARQGNTDSEFLQFGVFFAGYVKDEQKFCCVDQMGIPHEGTDRNIVIPFGGGATIALASWNVLHALQPDVSVTTPQQLADFTNAVCDSVAPLDAPADVWKITPEGSEKCEVTYTKALRC